MHQKTINHYQRKKQQKSQLREVVCYKRKILTYVTLYKSEQDLKGGLTLHSKIKSWLIFRRQLQVFLFHFIFITKT